MSHSYNRIWLHVVFSTKERQALLSAAIEEQVHHYMRSQLIELGCPVRIINGMPDHIHLLFLQNPKLSVSDIVKQVKGSSSHWINSQDLIPEKFAWQTGYAAYSVSDSLLDRVFQYIRGQKEHHSKRTFMQEYDEFISEHGLSREE